MQNSSILHTIGHTTNTLFVQQLNKETKNTHDNVAYEYFKTYISGKRIGSYNDPALCNVVSNFERFILLTIHFKDEHKNMTAINDICSRLSSGIHEKGVEMSKLKEANNLIKEKVDEYLDNREIDEKIIITDTNIVFIPKYRSKFSLSRPTIANYKTLILTAVELGNNRSYEIPTITTESLDGKGGSTLMDLLKNQFSTTKKKRGIFHRSHRRAKKYIQEKEQLEEEIDEINVQRKSQNKRVSIKTFDESTTTPVRNEYTLKSGDDSFATIQQLAGHIINIVSKLQQSFQLLK